MAAVCSGKISVLSEEIVRADGVVVGDEDDPPIYRLSALDNVMPRLYSQSCFFYRNRGSDSDDFMPEAQMKSSLSIALSYFPELGGRLRELGDGSLEVVCTNDGVKFICGSSDTHFSDLENASFAQQSLPDNMLPAIHVPTDQWPLRIQMTRFADNSGVVLSFMVHHSLCDGQGMFNFFKSWAAICSSGPGCETLVRTKPADRLVLAGDCKETPRHYHPEYTLIPPTPTPSGDDAMEQMLNRQETINSLRAVIFRFKKDRLNKLKTIANQQSSSGAELSTNDALVALLWKSVVRARGFNDHSDVSPSKGGTKGLSLMLGMACNGRGRLEPKLPLSFFGNVNVYVTVSLKPREIVEQLTVGEVASGIRTAVQAMTHERIHSAINWIARQPHKKKIVPGFQHFLGPDFAVTSWVRLGIYDVDFGFGKPSSFRLPVKKFDGLGVIFEASSDTEDLLVTLGLSNDALVALKNDAEFMKYAEWIG